MSDLGSTVQIMVSNNANSQAAPLTDHGEQALEPPTAGPHSCPDAEASSCPFPLHHHKANHCWEPLATALCSRVGSGSTSFRTFSFPPGFQWKKRRWGPLCHCLKTLKSSWSFECIFPQKPVAWFYSTINNAE